MIFCHGRGKEEANICEYSEECNEKIDCTASFVDVNNGNFPVTVYRVGFGQCKCMRDDGILRRESRCDMPRIISKTDDGGFSIDVPVRIIGHEYYVERHEYEMAMIKAISEIEKHKKAFENAKNERDMQASEMQSHIDCLKAELEEAQMNKQELPLEPIDVAVMLIKATVSCKANSIQKAFSCPEEYESDMYSKEDLLQIAEHLLVYCNNAGVE